MVLLNIKDTDEKTVHALNDKEGQMGARGVVIFSRNKKMCISDMYYRAHHAVVTQKTYKFEASSSKQASQELYLPLKRIKVN